MSGSSAAAQTRVAATGEGGPDAAPLVTVHTMTKVGGKWGVLLESFRDIPVKNCPQTIRSAYGDACFYADPLTDGPGPWVQVVVLNRRDLSLKENRDIYCRQATDKPREAEFDWDGNPCNAELSNLIARLNSGDLVIVVNQPETEASRR
jgi:hypothetical protein